MYRDHDAVGKYFGDGSEYGTVMAAEAADMTAAVLTATTAVTGRKMAVAAKAA